MVRHDLDRIAGAAFVVFVPPAGLTVLTAYLRTRTDSDVGTRHLLMLGALVATLALARALGEVFFSGFLDLAVGDHRFRGYRPSTREVVRDLPWLRLIAADLLLTVLVALGALLLVLPGLVVYTVFGIVGPVLVQERRTVRGALRRSAGIARRSWPWILGLVVAPLALEHAVAEFVHHHTHGGGFWLVVVGEWLLGTVVLGTVGVVEVALATELMARVPAPDGPTARDPGTVTPEASPGAVPTRRGAAG